MIVARFALWLAEVTDRLARWLAEDDLADRLADIPEIDHGEFVDPAPVIELDTAARRRARNRHPAGRARISQ